MPLVKTNREEIISEALKLFRQNGYYNTSMSDLAKVCGLQKGSFYHYFASKEIIMYEVLKSVALFLDEHVFSIADDKTLTPKLRMEKMLLALGKSLLSKKGGCIVGNTILETGGQDVIFKETLVGIFDDWKVALQRIFSEEYPDGTSSRLAESFMMQFEGAIMFSQLYNTDQHLKDVFVRALAKMK